MATSLTLAAPWNCTYPMELHRTRGSPRLMSPWWLPHSEDSAPRVIVRYFADHGVVCTEDEARIVLQDINPINPGLMLGMG